jgi:hypothetical protein
LGEVRRLIEQGPAHGLGFPGDLAAPLPPRAVPNADDPERRNIEFFVLLRTKIEHPYQRELQAVTSGRAHALVINFHAEMLRAFGQEYSLGNKLRFPVLVQSLTTEGVQEVH